MSPVSRPMLIEGISPRSPGGGCAVSVWRIPAIPPKTIADLSGGLVFFFSHQTLYPQETFEGVIDIRDKVLLPIQLPHINPNFERAVHLAVLHQVPPYNAMLVIALIGIFGKIELDVPQRDPIPAVIGRKLLDDLKCDDAILQHLISVNRQTDWNDLLVVPYCQVVLNQGAFRLSAVFRSGGREMPFHVCGATNEGDVVEIDYLLPSAAFIRFASSGGVLRSA